MKTPTPRSGSYYGSRIISTINPDGTWLESEEFAYPNGSFTRRAYVHFEGQLRVVRCSIADTYFSIPAVATVRGARIKGFISSDESGVKFTAYKGEKTS